MPDPAPEIQTAFKKPTWNGRRRARRHVALEGVARVVIMFGDTPLCGPKSSPARDVGGGCLRVGV